MAVMIVLAQHIRVAAGRRSVAGAVATPTDCTDGDKMPSEHEAQAYQMEVAALRRFLQSTTVYVYKQCFIMAKHPQTAKLGIAVAMSTAWQLPIYHFACLPKFWDKVDFFQHFLVF